MEASPGLTARSLGDLDDGPLRAVVAAWGNLARSGIVASEVRGRLRAEASLVSQVRKIGKASDRVMS